jgi:hypothetical protein
MLGKFARTTLSVAVVVAAGGAATHALGFWSVDGPADPPVKVRPVAEPIAVSGKAVTILAAGSIQPSPEIWDQARRDGSGKLDFGPMLAGAKETVSAADLALCSLSTPLSADGPFTGPPRYKAPAEMAQVIADTGFDGCSTAAEHSLDQGAAGVASTLSALDDAKRIAFANVFAANDPESTLMNIRQLEGQRLIARPLAMLINCRPDRVERNGQMGTLSGELDPDRVILIGEPTRSAKASVPGKLQSRVVDLGGKMPPERLLEEVLAAVPDLASIVACGNIHGQGEVLLHELADLPGWTSGETHNAHAGLPGHQTTGIR